MDAAALAIACSVIGTGMMAGFFYSFSIVIMEALARIGPLAGASAMRSINRVVLNPLFFLLFFGTGVTSLAAVATSIGEGGVGAILNSMAATLYCLGVLVVTIARNVPMNARLASDVPGSTGHDYWFTYLKRWTMWNHVRTISAIASCALYLLALLPVQ